ncbi:tRNA pseudouridine(38-40) synthase TruA [Candidatus Neoehrlichia procyonis]|uniref:tRNA pseudouridine synthase A n=1 Tax=Candidatus Neoehrlichia procyonis str. RAC413 TaxID=1359163 RepID=A0A0F3NPI4_9RICK|nr:tRNA pseudouridine(38-40) synthase TruA [Candidatus Neoehrlichia lotoris]KJV68824.1 tRNA pseudouridine(38-40) synthase [Candidatus Neoehrlichia lotoris str. RAC413]
MRYKITIEYDGSGFSGWQRQKYTNNSIQETIENAIFSFSQQRITVYAGGRTDAGVHALEQVAHFDLITHLDDYVIRNAINYHLRPNAISILSVKKVSNEFHARFSAKKRHYLYKITNRYSPVAIDYKRTWHIPKPLNVDNMVQAASYIIGKNNLSSFRSKTCQSKSPIKTIDNIIVTKNNQYIYIYISALSFLYKQVRIITGTLVSCGKELFLPAHMLDILNKKNRAAAGETAPPYGLYLIKIDY